MPSNYHSGSPTAEALLFSEPNVLALHIIRSLVESGLYVHVVAVDKVGWQELLKDLNMVRNIIITDAIPQHPAYVFSVIGFNKDKKESIDRVKQILSKQKEKVAAVNCKSVCVLPFYEESNADAQIKSSARELLAQSGIPIVYTGVVIGSGSKNEENTVVTLVKAAVEKGKVLMPQGADLYVAPAEETANEITKSVFAFGFQSDEVTIAKKITLENLSTELKKIDPNILIGEQNKFFYLRVNGPTLFVPIKGDWQSSLRKTYSYLKSRHLSPTPVKAAIVAPKPIPVAAKPAPVVAAKPTITKSLPQPKINHKTPAPPIAIHRSLLKYKSKRIGKIVVFAGFCLFWLIVFPFIWILLSAFSLGISIKSVRAGNMRDAKTYVVISDSLNSLAERELIPLTHLPLVGRGFNAMTDYTYMIKKTNNIITKSVNVYNYAVLVMSGIVKGDDYDLQSVSQKLHVDLDTLYKEISFLEGEIAYHPMVKNILLSRKSTTDEFKKYLSASSVLSSQLPVLLGKDRPTTYLVLFQNNSELRPTGGFIGSFAFLTFQDGKLVDFPVYDVYTADGQLKGHVEPPVAIVKYLGEASWYLRDSNWDPDFRVSAPRAKWFIDKEMDRPVDGVIAVDVELIRSLLKRIGPVNLPDLGVKIDDRNIYDKLQYEIESDFFPGSQKKANILTALERNLMEKLRASTSKDFLTYAEVLLSSLKERHVQVNVDNKDGQYSLENLGWDGGVQFSTCESPCRTINIALSEANVGVNKVNYFVKRVESFVTSIDNGKIQNKLVVSYTNNAPRSLDLRGRYKNYLRLMVNPESSFDKIELTDGVQKEVVDPEIEKSTTRLDAGVLVEVPPSSKKTVTFSWSETANKTANDQEILLKWRKQAGLEEEPISIRVQGTQKAIYASPAPNLTAESIYGYNTVLRHDLLVKILLRK